MQSREGQFDSAVTRP
nr:unnamed protein product [Callosobruchus chinensis]